jgi:hypothetical protein
VQGYYFARPAAAADAIAATHHLVGGATPGQRGADAAAPRSATG